MADLIYHDLDLVRVSQLKQARIQNITTTDRTTLGGTNTGLIVYDTDLQTLYVWDGSAWDSVGTTISGAMTFKGAVAFNSTEPVTPATGDFYVPEEGIYNVHWWINARNANSNENNCEPKPDCEVRYKAAVARGCEDTDSS